jgi:hypothetical protein
LKQILSAAGVGLKSFDPSRRTELLGKRHSAGDPLKGTQREQGRGRNAKGRQGAHSACPPYVNNIALRLISRNRRVEFSSQA